MSKTDLVGKFRAFENHDNGPSAEDNIANYLAQYSSDPLSEPELVSQLMKNVAREIDLSKVYRVKRMGKDLDDLFWSFGKIHGLENIAFADSQELKECNGNPVKLQALINKIDGPNKTFASFEELQAEANAAASDYKSRVEAMGLNPSDRKKLLSLPFYLAKRQEAPEPRVGQAEFELFKELTGNSWYDDAKVREDTETKITEFDYEKHLNPELLKDVDTDSDAFKEFIKVLNLFTQTKYEQL